MGGMLDFAPQVSTIEGPVISCDARYLIGGNSMRLRQLRYFEKVLELGSIRQASRELGISSPALSDQMRRLEEDLDIVLFHRGKQGSQPTDAARAIRPAVNRILESEIDIRETVLQIRGLDLGTLRLGIVTGATGPRFVKTLQAFRTSYPNVKFTMFEGGSLEIGDKLRKRELDVGAIVTIGDLTPGDLRLIPVSEARLGLLVRAGSELAEHEMLRTEDLQGERLIVHPAGSVLGAAAVNYRELLGLTEVATADHQNGVLQMVQGGLGIALSSGLDLSDVQTERDLKIVPLATPTIATALSLAIRTDQQSLPAVREFVRLFSQVFSKS